MTRFAAFVLFLLAALLPAPLAAQAGWITHAPADGGYSVLMPAVPDREVNQFTEGDLAPGRTMIDTIVVDRELFMAGWAEYNPAGRLDLQEELLANRDNTVNGIEGAVLVSSVPIGLNGWPGIDFTAVIDTRLVLRARVFVIGRRPYQVMAMVAPERAASSEVQAFLDSFRVSYAP